MTQSTVQRLRLPAGPGSGTAAADEDEARGGSSGAGPVASAAAEQLQAALQRELATLAAAHRHTDALLTQVLQDHQHSPARRTAPLATQPSPRPAVGADPFLS
jgi:hypothetical protein